MNDISLYDESVLFSRLAAGDEKAFRQIFEKFREKVFAFIGSMSKSDAIAEELTQDVFLKIWTNKEKLGEVKAGYIFAMARNRTIDYLRQVSLEKKLIQGVWERLVEIQDSTREQIDFNESKRIVDKAIKGLSPQKQLIFQLSRMEGLKHAEIAEKLNISPNTVKVHLTESLKYIREYLRTHSDTLPVLFTIAFIA